MIHLICVLKSCAFGKRLHMTYFFMCVELKKLALFLAFFNTFPIFVLGKNHLQHSPSPQDVCLRRPF